MTATSTGPGTQRPGAEERLRALELLLDLAAASGALELACRARQRDADRLWFGGDVPEARED